MPIPEPAKLRRPWGCSQDVVQVKKGVEEREREGEVTYGGGFLQDGGRECRGSCAEVCNAFRCHDSCGVSAQAEREVVWCKTEGGESEVRSSEIRLDPVLDAARVWS
jgi:hypothetical protein